VALPGAVGVHNPHIVGFGTAAFVDLPVEGKPPPVGRPGGCMVVEMVVASEGTVGQLPPAVGMDKRDPVAVARPAAETEGDPAASSGPSRVSGVPARERDDQPPPATVRVHHV